jgi:H+/Na+-translocating ferredoxin:NAD+ oxidoreductase subunit A
MEYFVMINSAILVNNILLAQYLGNCPFLGVSKRMDTALGMGAAVIFTMTLASVLAWCVHHYLLVPLELEFLRTIAFILVIASLVQFVEIFMKKMMDPLYQALGLFLPLITTNCAVLGVAILCVKANYSFLKMLIFSLSSGIGFALALVLFAGLRERFAISRIPRTLQGTAIGLVTAGLMSLAFLGFMGMT